MMQAPDSGSLKRIRLLIVDDMPEMAQNVQKLLHFARNIQVVGVATSGQDAISLAASLRPDVVLMDINLHDMNGLRATELIMQRTPTHVIMMSVQGEPEYIQRAMFVGARGYLIKPFSSEELLQSIKSVAALPLPPTAGSSASRPSADPNYQQVLSKIIAVYSPKGGVGRSVIAANLAIMIKREADAQNKNTRVLLVDANLRSGDAHIVINFSSNNSIDDLREASSLDGDIISQTITNHEGSGIDILRAPVSLSSADLFTADNMKLILAEIREHYDYVVVDADSSFSEPTLAVLEIADIILLVTTLEVTTIHRVAQFFEIMDSLGYAKSKVKMVCNRVDTMFGIQPRYIETRLRQSFLSQIPEDVRLVVTSINRGLPFVMSHRNASVSKSIQTLAQRVMTVLAKSEEGAEEKRKWFR